MLPNTCTVTFAKQHRVPRFAILRLLLSLLLAGTPVFTQEDSVDALVSRGDRERLQGRYAAALATYALARDKAEVSGDRPGAAGAWNGLGVTYATQSDFAGALDALSRALAIREEVGLWPEAATSLTNIGGVYRVPPVRCCSNSRARTAATLRGVDLPRVRPSAGPSAKKPST